MAVAVEALLQKFDNYGKPLAGGRIYTYAAGTTTPLASYTDQGGTVVNTNPVVLDAAGRAQLWLTANTPYKLVLTDLSGVVLDTTDNFYAGATPDQLQAAGIVPATGGTYTGPVTLAGGTQFGGTATQDLATLNSLGVAGARSRNLWINSTLAIAQRGVGTYADSTYGFDRVINLTQSAAVAISSVPFGGRWTQSNATPQRIGFAQIAENGNCVYLNGRQAVFALQVRCSQATTIRAALVAWTGTADTPAPDPIAAWASTNYTPGNFFIASTTVIAVAGIAVQSNVWTDLVVSSASAGGILVPSTMQNLYMIVWSDAALPQNTTLDAAFLRCSQGTEAPLIQPIDLAEEWGQCQRYHERGTADLRGYNVAGGALGYRVPFAVRKRATPSVSFGATGGTNFSGISASAASSDSFLFSFGATATGASFATADWIANAEF